MTEPCCEAHADTVVKATRSNEVLMRSLDVHGGPALAFNGVEVSDYPLADVVWWCHDPLSWRHRYDQEAVVAENINRVSHVVYSSTWHQTLGTALLNVPSAKGFVIPYWIDRLVPITSKYEEETTCFVWAGSPGKGLGILHATLRHLIKEENLDVRLVVFSNDDNEAWHPMMQHVTQDEWVEFRGRPDNDDVRRCVAEEGHVSALSFSSAESCPLQLIEALTAGMVPVLPCYAGLPEAMIVDRGTMYRWDSDPMQHAIELATKINSLVKFRNADPKAFEALAMSYHTIARVKYDWDTVSGVWGNFTRGIADRG